MCGFERREKPASGLILEVDFLPSVVCIASLATEL